MKSFTIATVANLRTMSAWWKSAVWSLAAIILLLPLKTLQGQPVRSMGSYVGTGVNRSIAGLGFQPDVLIIKSSGNPDVIKTTTMGGSNSKRFSVAAVYDAGWITALDSDGFSLGTNATVNGNGTTYYYFAFKAGAKVIVGSYTGNATATHNIPIAVSPPAYGIIIPSTTEVCGELFLPYTGSNISINERMTATKELSFLGSTSCTGFTIGASVKALNYCGSIPPNNSTSICNLNVNATVYHYVIFNNDTGVMNIGKYTGTGASITQPTGFAPGLVFVKGITPYQTIPGTCCVAFASENDLNTNSQLTYQVTILSSATMPIDGGTDVNSMALTSSGFTSGTDTSVNTNGNVYHWAAFLGHTAALTGSTTACSGAGAFLTAASDGSALAANPYSYYKDGVLISGPTAASTYAATVAGSYTVSIKYTDNSTALSTALTVAISGSPTISLSANATACFGGSPTANLSYSSVTGSPNQYSILFDSAAHAAGFADVINAALPASPIVISLPSNVSVGNYNGTLTVKKSSTGCVSTGSSITVAVIACQSTATLSLQLFIQGYYFENGQMRPALYNEGVNGADPLEVDTISVDLRLDTTGHPLAASVKTMLMTDGSATANFPLSINGGTYWIVIRNRSTIATWSAAPVAFSINTSYTFSDNSTKAFGNNMAEIEPSVWGIYSGDINHDQNIDLIDFPSLDFGINNGLYGYYVIDLNGDGNVDLLDFPILDSNIDAGVFTVHP